MARHQATAGRLRKHREAFKGQPVRSGELQGCVSWRARAQTDSSMLLAPPSADQTEQSEQEQAVSGATVGPRDGAVAASAHVVVVVVAD